MIKKNKIILLVISIILISACSSSQNPLDVMDIAQQKAENLNYVAEYTTKIETTSKGNSFSQVFTTITSKDGPNKKTEVYVKEIVLLQETIETEFEFVNCYYGKSIEDINCLQINKPKKLDTPREILTQLIENHILNIKTSSKIINLGSKELECTNLEYKFDFSKLTPQTATKILQLFPEFSKTDEEIKLNFIEEFSSAICFDKQTGLPLESSSNIGYVIPNTAKSDSFYQSTTQKIQRLDRTPLFSKTEFTIPKQAKVKDMTTEESK